ncbi:MULTISPECIES: aldehyde dehydrogenase family protein [Vreelandella]|uniref:Aldehyde dehydrogenase family protein n=2 Tax=Vreelandella TaxID=3137766 RepID=A0ABU1GA22_9GAMM|nr:MULTISPECIES: aldehyde dehydrogenase family protein [Halomonas]MCZ0927587.1 aldehyde dehydrogenase family protein [Halomonas janggokensis]MCZ0930095.1 aldehyde dehydrogenase family protein [Halomonas janggokensis]MDR5874333.1 aldehyde dehydrogenase family protein [Halomonas gomseomensis]
MNQHTASQVVQDFFTRATGSFIDGAFLADGQARDVLDPSTGQPLTRVAEGDTSLADRAVALTRQSVEDGRWSGMTPAARERILLRFADLLEEHGEELAQIETLNQGKSINIARGVDVGFSVDFIRYMAGWTTKLEGSTREVSIGMPEGAKFNTYTLRQPIGVVAAIVPWNFPMMIALWKVVPALAAGCSVVLKPASETPLSVLRLAELAVEAGVPKGVFNVVLGSGATVGTRIAEHPDVGKVTFTGSTAIGKQVGHAAVEHMAHFSLELGGKNPMLVLEDADIDKAVNGALLGGLFNQGQVCAAASRFYVHRSLHDTFCERLAQAVDGMQAGPGMDPQAQVNPLVSKRQQASVQGYIDRARDQGANVHVGNKVPSEGFYVSPTVISGADHDMEIAREEVFGPVLTVIPFDDDEQALRMVNDSELGLAASLWTESLSKAMALTPRIEAGTVWVNTHVTLDPAMPFGGLKMSGLGKEFGPEAVNAYTELKSVCIAY